jgi:cell division protein FtsL
MVHDNREQERLLDTRRQDVKTRLTRETRIGLPIKVLVALLIVTALSMLLYLVTSGARTA